jgi:predicted RNA-binding protein with PIN domain
MAPFPDDVVRSLVKGVGAFMRQTPANELPRSLRAMRNFTNKALVGRSQQVLAALEDEALRARILKWLGEKPSLARSDAKTLDVAVRREADWEETLASGSNSPRSKPHKQTDDRLKAKAEEYKSRAETARSELKRVRQETRAEAAGLRRDRAQVDAEMRALKEELKGARGDLTVARRTIKELEDRLERERRRARREKDKAEQQQESLKSRIKDAKAENTELKRRLARSRTAKTTRAKRQAPSPGPRTREKLKAPKGLLADARDTLARWLQTPGLILVVDGYNVTKHEKGFGDLSLATQRDRLIAELQQLSARYPKASFVVVFDGSEVPPGTTRRRKGRVKIEYSRPDEIADDHIVARVEELPPVPVVVVTSDRDLQTRAAKLDATVATSPQLLELLRKV